MTEAVTPPNGRQSFDPVGQSELALNRVFLAVFRSEAARKRFGFRQISPVVSEDGFPGWYLWFHEHPGAFLLKACSAELLPRAEAHSAASAFSGIRFAVYYYPHPEEAVFDDFSWPEKIVRLSGCFDDTGTPSAKKRKNLPESFFWVGTIDTRFETSMRFLDIEAASMDRWRDYRVKGLILPDSSGQALEVCPAGGRDRNIPGWDLTHFLGDKLIMGICFTYGIAPQAVFVSRRNGTANLLYPDGIVEHLKDPEVSEMMLTAALASPSERGTSADGQWHAFGVALCSTGDVLESIVGEILPADICSQWINPRWWQAKNEMAGSIQVQGCCCLGDH